jgi:hypothetical protein
MKLKVVIVDKNNKILMEIPQVMLQELLNGGMTLEEIIRSFKEKTHGIG